MFDTADSLVDDVVDKGRKGFGAAYRDAVMVKTAYAWGLRRRELVMLDVHDFSRNPKASEFGEFGVCTVRFGKAMAGSTPKRRGVFAIRFRTGGISDKRAAELPKRVLTTNQRTGMTIGCTTIDARRKTSASKIKTGG